MQIIHALSRGTDKRKIFMDKQDYLRFIHDLFEFNDQAPANNILYRFSRKPNSAVGHYANKEKRKLLVALHAFCLMPNHYHLLLSPLIENGVSLFMRKINVGYVKYFNQKYERKGTLFEGRYKSVRVANESHLLHLPYYIHLNPLDLFSPGWRQHEAKNYAQCMKFLESYRWSSFLDYIGKPNFPSVTQREFFMEFFNGPGNFKRDITGWLREAELSSIKHLTLE
ncbi:MAG: transposase [Candidatus Jorgensenbacteria bacterium]